MSNKLKDVFSNKMFEMGCNLSFRNQEAHNKFLEALEIVYDEGRTVKVDGVSEISTHVKDGNMIYPLMVERIPTELVVGLSIEPVSITIDTVCGKKDIKFQRYQTKSNIVLETIENAIVFLKFVFEKDRHQVQFTYRKQVQFAKKVKNVAESYCIAMGILNYFFKPYNEQDASDNMDSLYMLKQAFQMAYSFWDKLNLIEEELAFSFLPEKFLIQCTALTEPPILPFIHFTVTIDLPTLFGRVSSSNDNSFMPSKLIINSRVSIPVSHFFLFSFTSFMAIPPTLHGRGVLSKTLNQPCSLIYPLMDVFLSPRQS